MVRWLILKNNWLLHENGLTAIIRRYVYYLQLPFCFYPDVF